MPSPKMLPFRYRDEGTDEHVRPIFVKTAVNLCSPPLLELFEADVEPVRPFLPTSDDSEAPPGRSSDLTFSLFLTTIHPTFSPSFFS